MTGTKVKQGKVTEDYRETRREQTARQKRVFEIETAKAKALSEVLLSPQQYKRVISLLLCHVTSLEVKRQATRGFKVEHWQDEIDYYTRAIKKLRGQVTVAHRLRIMDDG